MSFEAELIDYLTRAGYRVTKPKAKKERPTLNAIGKPYSPQFDPGYRVKHKTTTAHLFKPYGDIVRDHLSSWS